MTNSVLEKLLKKQQQLEARIKSLKAKDVSQKRKDETRMKILVGAHHITKAKKEGTWDQLVQEMDASLERKQDRLLFGLQVQEETLAEPKAQKVAG